MDRISCVEDPIMLLWACVLAFALQFSFALLLLRGLYSLRTRMLDTLEPFARWMFSASDLLSHLRAPERSTPEAAERVAGPRSFPTCGGYDRSRRCRDADHPGVDQGSRGG